MMTYIVYANNKLQNVHPHQTSNHPDENELGVINMPSVPKSWPPPEDRAAIIFSEARSPRLVACMRQHDSSEGRNFYS